MLQYLINTSAIWLMSLLIFDIFLRRENYHSYNRIYLIGTLLAGALIPLVHWRTQTVVQEIHPLHFYNSMVELQAHEAVHQSTITHIAPAHHYSFATIIAAIYIAGALIKIILLAKETFQLRSYYKEGKKTNVNGWLIIETGKAHGPFSISNYLFINSRTQYDSAQLEIILQHEQEHRRLLHVADLILIQLCSIIFWFQPFIYLYTRRLRMVHEYQADNTAAKDEGIYSQLLIETSLLSTYTQLTHSFSRSPIKNRILMLQHRSSKSNKVKLLTVLPLIACSLFFFTECRKVTKAKEPASIDPETALMGAKIEFKTRLVTFKGNVFEVSTPVKTKMPAFIKAIKKQAEKMESMPPTAKINEDTFMVTIYRPPIRMNKDSIYSFNSNDGSQGVPPEFLGTDGNINKYIYNGCMEDMSMLDDGEYGIGLSDLVIDKNGKLVYYSTPTINKDGAGKIKAPAKIIARAISLLDNAPNCKPAMKDGKNVVAILNEQFEYDVVVKNHKAELHR
ncbi:MAG: M56 family metallopeptidase, partial [Flavipsychrobacter sp.]